MSTLACHIISPAFRCKGLWANRWLATKDFVSKVRNLVVWVDCHARVHVKVGGGGCRVEVLMHYNCPFCSTDALVFTCLPAASGGRDLPPRNFGWLFLAGLYCRKNVASVSFIPFLSLLLSPFPTSTSSHKDIYSFFLNMQTHYINIVNYKFSG